MSQPLFLAIDFINEIIHPNGKMPRAAEYVRENKVLEFLNKAIKWGRDKEIPIAHVIVGFSDDYIECPKNSPLFGGCVQKNALKLGTWGTDIHDDISVEPEDSFIIKHRVSPFYSTGLETLLRANQIDTLILTGVSTDMAVESAARDAHDRDYRVIVVEDACATVSKEAHEAALKVLSRIATVTQVDKLDKISFT